MTVHIDQAALERIVRARVGPSTKRLAAAIGDKVEEQGIEVGAENGDPDEVPLPVRVDEEPDGEARVTLAHPAGKAVQAKHGALTRAAASLGLEVRR